MNFGAFAGGLSSGFHQGIKMGKTMQEIARERGLQEMREKGMAEAEAKRAKSVDDMIQERKPESETPTSGPIDTETPKVEAPKTAQEISEASPTASPDAAAAKTAAAAMAPVDPAQVSASSPTANPDPAGAAAATAAMPQGSQLPPSVSTQAPQGNTVVGKPAGMLQQGNIDLGKRPVVKNPDGSISTVRSISIGVDGKEVLIPTVSDDGRVLSDSDAIKQYQRTGKHLGVFDSPDAATAYAENLHNQQDKAYSQQPAPASPQQAVAGQGMPGSAAPAKGNIPGQSGFWVNGQRYDTREQARAAADKAAPSTMDFFMKNAVPQIAQQYMVNGDPATAKAWTDYADSHDGKSAIKKWAAAYTAPDFDTAVSRFGAYYTDHINDGVDYTGHKLKVNADGTQVAVVQLKDKATGKTTEMELTREKMLALGGANNPQKLFEMEQAKQREADKLKLEYGMKAKERVAKREDDIFMEGVRQGGRLQVEGAKARNKIDEIAFKHEMDAEFEQKYKKTTDPDERRAILRSDAMKNDPKFARLSKDEQNKYLDDAEDTLKSKFRSQGNGPSTEAAAPKFADKPMAFDKALPVYKNNKTGQRFHLKDGVMFPIADAPATQPAPAAPAPAPAQAAPAPTAPAAPVRPQASGLPAQPAPATTPEPAKAPAQPIDGTPEGLSSAKAALDTANNAYQQVMADYQFATSLKNRANVTPTQLAAIQAELKKAEAAMSQAKETYRLTNDAARKARADAAYSPAAALAESAKAGAASRLSKYGQ